MDTLPSNGTNANLTLSVVIITCERPDYLSTSLQSALNQTTPADEIIIVDDCSEADYSAVIDSNQDSRIRYIRLDKRSGANVARNTGINNSSGDIVAFLDDDDIWLKDFLAQHLLAIQNGADAVICGHKILESENEININPLEKVDEDELRHGNRFSGMSGFSATRKVLTAVQFDPELKNGQDWDLFVRIVQHGYVFINIKQALFLYRRGTPDGITSKAKKMRLEDAEKRLGSAFKHREWLGSRYYNQRVAEQLLSFLPSKQNKFGWLKKSYEMAGARATCSALLKKVIK